MAEQPRSAADVIEIVKEHDVRFVRLWFTDVLGQLKSFSINAAELEDAFEGGMGFDGSSITGFNPIEESDMIAMPDPSTFALIPWRPEEENAVARMFCDIRVPGGGPYEGDPRWIMRRALKRAEELGFDAYNIGPELEFFYFRSAKPEGGVPEVLDEGGYFDLTTLDAGSDVRRETVLALEKMGIHVEYTHHEVGPSQHEVDMRYKNALEMADDCMTYRIVVKEYAMKYGWHATFMPKPLFGENGSGMHVHQSLSQGRQERLLRRRRPVLPLADGEVVHRRPAQARARDLAALRPVGQLLQAAGARLRGAGLPRLVAPQPLGADPGAALPPRQGGGDPGRAALPRPRLPTPTSASPAMLQAGLEGIEKGYELPEPMEQNLYHLSPEELGAPGDRAAAGDARRGDRGRRRVGAGPAHPRRAHLPPLRRDQAAGMGRLPGPGHPVRDRELPADPL